VTEHDRNEPSGEEVLERIRSAGRRVFPMHEYLAAHDPRGLEGYNEFLQATIYDKDDLDERYREIVLACACVAAGSPPAVIAAHCRKALEAGASRGEVIQALELTAAVFATRTMASGITALMEADPS
jgi:alkylhydroperoxidase/carboxymuconolactone decarboxylase family protein YurZ